MSDDNQAHVIPAPQILAYISSRTDRNEPCMYTAMLNC